MDSANKLLSLEKDLSFSWDYSSNPCVDYSFVQPQTKDPAELYLKSQHMESVKYNKMEVALSF